MKHSAVLLFSVPLPHARKGVVAEILQFLVSHGASILHADDHIDTSRELFLTRLEWDLNNFDIPISDFETYFNPLSTRFEIKYHLVLTDQRPRVVILVSAYDHCIADLLHRHRTGELNCEIVVIISNHRAAE